MRRRVVMRYTPFISALSDKHGEARWSRRRFTLHHPGKRVKASDHDSVIVDCDCTPFVNRILVSTALEGREISYNCLSTFGHNGTAVPSRIASDQ